MDSSKRTKKGQVTVYILVGLVLLILFGSLFYFVNLAKAEQFNDANKDAALDKPLNKAQLQETITQCLKQASEDAVFVMGLQSGHIFDGQNGQDPSLNGISYRHTNQVFTIPFGIINGKTEPPQYPVSFGDGGGYKYTLERIQFEYDRFNPIWGVKQLPKLCDLRGLNAPSSQAYSCDTSAYGRPNTTIQNKLEFASQRGVKSCLEREQDFISQITDDFDYESPRVRLLITDSDIKFILTLNATVIQSGESSQLSEVTHTLPVRLNRVYNLLNYIIESDISDVLFDKSRDYVNITLCNYAQTVQCWDQDMVVSIIRNPQPVAHPGGDIILIEDRGSLNKGQPFYFATSVENRPPMLDYLRSSTLNTSVDYEVNPGETLTFRPQAYDPDEDTLIIKYLGWKQNGFERSAAYTTNQTCPQTPFWCASYVLTDLLPGLKQLRPTVYDDTNLSDHQPLLIRIGDAADDDGLFCPDNVDGLNPSSCDPRDANCLCNSGAYCRWNVNKPITCEPGSVCCQEILTGGDALSNLMTCDGAECYQNSNSAPIAQVCNGGNCTQYTNSGVANQTCLVGSNCWQETRKGSAEQLCDGAYCLQETDTGNLTTDCRLTPSTDDQGGTLRICR